MDQQKPQSGGGPGSSSHGFMFPRWANLMGPLTVLGALSGVTLAIFVVWYYFSPKHTDVGYSPVQPAEYNHKLHAGDMAIDCRYCHVNVERAAVASVPPTQVCMNCHVLVNTQMTEAQLKRFEPIQASFDSGNPVKWVRIHKTPDYAYFDHSAHVTRGVGCVSCHGRIDEMARVQQVQPLSMSWCLECHKDPVKNLRPVSQVTNMGWTAGPDSAQEAQALVEKYKIKPPFTDCSGCHR